MSFISLQFLVFFMVVTLSYYQLKNQRMRIALLLVASCYFYMSFVPVYILILGGTIVVDYFAGILIENHVGKKRKMFLAMSIVAYIAVLAVFKYYNFLNHNLSILLNGINYRNPIPYLSILLPIG